MVGRYSNCSVDRWFVIQAEENKNQISDPYKGPVYLSACFTEHGRIFAMQPCAGRL